MGLVVLVAWVSLAIGAEVEIMADSTLVASALDVGLAEATVAKRAVTVDANMTCLLSVSSGKRLVNGYETMTMSGLFGVMAGSAEVKVRTLETLVADTVNRLELVLACHILQVTLCACLPVRSGHKLRDGAHCDQAGKGF